MNEKLQGVAQRILRQIRNTGGAGVWAQVQFADYHGFLKGGVPESILSNALAESGLSPAEVQAEFVRVERDLTHEVHRHNRSAAFAVCLGLEEGVTPPCRAQAFIGGRWVAVGAGEEVDIPPGQAHGFTVESGGELTFLSVQSPPITWSGEDDYERVSTAEAP